MNKKKLMSLEEFNLIKQRDNRAIYFNGIACPKCGEELIDTHPNQVLASKPAKKATKCINPECDYRGYRLA